MLLDTDILIDLSRRHPPALEWFASLTENPTVSGIAALEVAYGCRDRRALNDTMRFLLPLPISWPSIEDMQRALVEFAAVRLSSGLGLMDALTAALALRLQEPVATFNVKHFIAVPGVTTIQPYAR